MEAYEKIRILGTGSFGSAWMVYSKIERIYYVVKEISIQSMKVKDKNAAINEVKILGTLKHKNIIRYKDALVYEKNLCILMEYADDGMLNSISTLVLLMSLHYAKFDTTQAYRILVNFCKVYIIKEWRFKVVLTVNENEYQ